LFSFSWNRSANIGQNFFVKAHNFIVWHLHFHKISLLRCHDKRCTSLIATKTLHTCMCTQTYFLRQGLNLYVIRCFSYKLNFSTQISLFWRWWWIAKVLSYTLFLNHNISRLHSYRLTIKWILCQIFAARLSKTLPRRSRAIFWLSWFIDTTLSWWFRMIIWLYWCVSPRCRESRFMYVMFCHFLFQLTFWVISFHSILFRFFF
jgi:hypothetical protein